MTSLDFSFLSWQFVQTYLLKGLYFTLFLTLIPLWAASSSAPFWR